MPLLLPNQRRSPGPGLGGHHYHSDGKSHKEQLFVVACAVLRVGHHAPASLLLGK